MSSGLGQRVLTAVVAIPILLASFWWSEPWLFHAIAAAAVLMAVYELFHMADLAGAPPFRMIGYASTAAVLAMAAWGRPGYMGVVLVAMTIALMLGTLARVEAKEKILVSAGATALAVLYVGVLGSYLLAIRAIAVPSMPGKLLTLFCAVIMLSDSGAYFAGRALGRHKLAPRVSPAKTVEGLVGGLIAGVAGAAASKYLFFPEIPLLDALVLGLVLGVLGAMGDLCESLLKRGSNVKDAASILPGHGGFLDRLDSMLLNAPVLYYYYVLVLEPRLGAQ